MKKTLTACAAAWLVALRLAAQTTAPETPVLIADRMPLALFPSCKVSEHSYEENRSCTDTELLRFLAKTVVYPNAAREARVQGTVVISFVVERDGSTSRHAVTKDIGHGCGDEAVRAFKTLADEGIRWAPGQKDGRAVPVKMSLPVRFKLAEEAPLPLAVTERGDTVFERVTQQPAFKMGADSLLSFIVHKTVYPSKYREACKAGIVEVSLLIRPDGTVRVDNVIDYNGLGPDFEFEAIRMANQMNGLWHPAEYGPKPVATALPIRVEFKSSANECAAANETFALAMVKADTAMTMYERGATAEALEKANESLSMAPNNAEMLYLRGLLSLQAGRKEEACGDWRRVKEQLGATWFEPVRRLACGI